MASSADRKARLAQALNEMKKVDEAELQRQAQSRDRAVETKVPQESKEIAESRKKTIELVQNKVIKEMTELLKKEFIEIHAVFFMHSAKHYPGLTQLEVNEIKQSFDEKFESDSKRSSADVIRAARNAIDHARTEAEKYLTPGKFVTACNAFNQALQKLDSSLVDQFYLKKSDELSNDDLKKYVKHINNYLESVDRSHKKTWHKIDLAILHGDVITKLKGAVNYKLPEVEKMLSAKLKKGEERTPAREDEIMLQQDNAKYFLVYALDKAIKQSASSPLAFVQSLHTDLMNYEWRHHNKVFFESDTALRQIGYNPQNLIQPDVVAQVSERKARL